MPEPRRWTVTVCDYGHDIDVPQQPPYCICGAGLDCVEVVEAAPVDARIAELEAEVRRLRSELAEFPANTNAWQQAQMRKDPLA